MSFIAQTLSKNILFFYPVVNADFIQTTVNECPVVPQSLFLSRLASSRLGRRLRSADLWGTMSSTCHGIKLGMGHLPPSEHDGCNSTNGCFGTVRSIYERPMRLWAFCTLTSGGSSVDLILKGSSTQ